MAPLDPNSVAQFKEDPVCARFLADAALMAATEATVPLASINAADVACVFWVGGHGPMWDMPGERGIVQRALQVARACGAQRGVT